MLPYRHSTKCLAYFRATAAISFTNYLIIVPIFNGPEYFLYLTNWGNFLNALNFLTLMQAHFFEGHYSCAKKPKKWKCCALYWKWTVFLYELVTLLIIEITFCYWTIVFPFLVSGPKWVSINNKNIYQNGFIEAQKTDE